MSRIEYQPHDFGRCGPLMGPQPLRAGMTWGFSLFSYQFRFAELLDGFSFVLTVTVIMFFCASEHS